MTIDRRQNIFLMAAHFHPLAGDAQCNRSTADAKSTLGQYRHPPLVSYRSEPVTDRPSFVQNATTTNCAPMTDSASATPILVRFQ
jgi:hypothetical protein